MTVFTPDVERGNFERTVNELATQRGVSPDTIKAGYKLMPHVLRIAAYLQPSQSTYVFNIKKGVDTPIPGEIKLDQTDAFAATAIGIRFSKADYASGIYSNHGNFPHLTFPDPAYFVGAPASGTTKKEYEALQSLINGTLAVNVGGDTVIDGMVGSLFVFNPMSTYATSPAIALPQLGGSMEEQGFYPLTPQFVFDGANDNQLTLSVAVADRTLIDGSVTAAGSAATTRNLVWLYIAGYKVKNHTSAPQSLTACRPV